MKHEELISIVITTYRRSGRLEKAIRSAINQTYTNTEIIVVDDNSKNLAERKKTEAIAKKYKGVVLIKNERNLGGGPSRNVGIKAAKGELISFLDDDDQYLPTRLDVLYKIFNEHRKDNVGLAYCSCDAIDQNDKIIAEYINTASGRPFYQQMYNCIAPTSMWLASKKALNVVGGFDDIPSKQDSTVILKLLVAGYTVYGTKDKLVLYYTHNNEDGISGTKMSNADGIIRYRDKCRKQYCRVTKEQLASIECNFSRQLITIYLVNDKTKQAKKELNNIWKNNPFSMVYYKNYCKILFRKIYLIKIKKGRK